MAADGRVEAPAPTGGTGNRNGWLWLNIFRSFQVALDPRKLLVAAIGILVMSLGWWLLSVIFMAGYGNNGKPIPADYNRKTLESSGVKPPQTSPTEAEATAFYDAEQTLRYDRALARYKLLEELAGEGGRLRTLPWNEFRGQNPYLFASALSSSPSATWGDQIWAYLSSQIPVLTEPLQKILLPILKMADPNASTYTRIYLILCLAWSIVTWAFFGGVITRLAAVQFNGKERTTLKQAVKFVTSRYVSYVLSPTVPLAVVAVIVLLMAIYGLVALIPWVGDILLYGLLFPLIIIGGVAIAIILLGLVGYPLMYCTISVEGSDTFDAISRSYNYVFQAPWSFLWYTFVSLLYGAAVSFIVILIGCVMVGLGKGAVSIPASAVYEPRKPDFLFVYAPESLGWKELLLRGTPIEVEYKGRKPTAAEEAAYEEKLRQDNKPSEPKPWGYHPTRPERAEAYMKEMWWYNYAGAGLAWFWMTLVFLLMIGFTYSFFWTAATMVYLLMRKKVDEVELDEVYIEEVPPTPTPPAVPPTTPPAMAPGGGVSLPTVPPPPPAVTSPPPPTTAPEVSATSPPPPPAVTE